MKGRTNAPDLVTLFLPSSRAAPPGFRSAWCCIRRDIPQMSSCSSCRGVAAWLRHDDQTSLGAAFAGSAAHPRAPPDPVSRSKRRRRYNRVAVKIRRLSRSDKWPSPRIAHKTAASLPGKAASIRVNPSSPSISVCKPHRRDMDAVDHTVWQNSLHRLRCQR
jgi:hypothetical protein